MQHTLNEKLIKHDSNELRSHDVKEQSMQQSIIGKKTNRYWMWLSGVMATYDICMVFPLDNETNFLTNFCIKYLEHLNQVGIDFFLCYSLQRDSVFVLIRAKIERLRTFAAELEYQMLLDPVKLKEAAESGCPEKDITPLCIPHIPEESRVRPHDFIYAPYRSDVDESLYWRPLEGEGCGGLGLDSHPFRDLTRLKLTQLLMETYSGVNVEEEEGNQTEEMGKINIRKHLNQGRITACFPLHRQEKLALLQTQWLAWHVLPWQAPLFEVKVSTFPSRCAY